MGPTNSGKSTCWVRWGEWMEKTGDGNVYVGDTDFATERMLGGGYEGDVKIGGVEWAKYGNIHVSTLMEWSDYIAFSDFCAKIPGRDDLVVVDMINKAWEEVKQDFAQQVYGKDMDEFFLEAKMRQVKAGKEGGNAFADSHGQTWDVINKRYARFMTGAVYRTKAHVLACTPADKIDRDRDKGEVLNLYGRYSMKPQGQKHLGHAFHTILLVSEERKGHIMTTVKERDIRAPEPERVALVGDVYEDFVVDYLMVVGGWKK